LPWDGFWGRSVFVRAALFLEGQENGWRGENSRGFAPRAPQQETQFPAPSMEFLPVLTVSENIFINKIKHNYQFS